jgi:hypothetical protein
MHVTQDIICEEEKSGQPDGSPASSRPPWPEEGGLKENSLPEEGPVKGPVKRKIRYVCSELLNLAVASIIEGRMYMATPESSVPLGSNQASSSGTSKQPDDPKHACTPGTLPRCSGRPKGPEEASGPKGSGSPGGAPREELGKRKESLRGLSSPESLTQGSSHCAVSRRPGGGPHGAPSTRTSPGAMPNDRTELIGTQLFSALCVSEKPCRFLKEASLYVSIACTSFPPLPGNSETEEMSVTSIVEEYVVSTPTALEMRRLRRTRACMRRALDYYPKKVLRTINPVKLKNKKQCSPSEEPVKTKDIDKEDDQRQAMEKPVKAKTVTWMRQGATKAMSTIMTKSAKVVPRVIPTRSKWRI